jgi:hypothetical protein
VATGSGAGTATAGDSADGGLTGVAECVGVLPVSDVLGVVDAVGTTAFDVAGRLGLLTARDESFVVGADAVFDADGAVAVGAPSCRAACESTVMASALS